MNPFAIRALDEIVQASPLDPLSTRQVLAALVVTGALGVRVLHAGRPRGQATQAIDLARVKDKLEQVRRADYFTVLGVGRLCTPHEVREAAERLLAEFDPRRFAGAPDEGLPARLAEIAVGEEPHRMAVRADLLIDLEAALELGVVVGSERRGEGPVLMRDLWRLIGALGNWGRHWKWPREFTGA